MMSKFLLSVKFIFKNEYAKDNLVRLFIILSLALNVALWIYIKTQIKDTPYSIALHYTIYFGIDLLGKAEQALIIAVVGFLIWIVNVIVGYHMYSHSRIASYLLNLTSVLAQIFLLIAVYGLILINQ